MSSYLQNINLRTSYAFACCVVIVSFVLLVGDQVGRYSDRMGTQIFLSNDAWSVLSWVLTGSILIAGVIGALRKSPVSAIGPFAMYLFSAEVLGGMYFVPNNANTLLIVALFVCMGAAALMRHPFYFGAKHPLPDDASGVKQSLQNVATSIRK